MRKIDLAKKNYEEKVTWLLAKKWTSPFVWTGSCARRAPGSDHSTIMLALTCNNHLTPTQPPRFFFFAKWCVCGGLFLHPKLITGWCERVALKLKNGSIAIIIKLSASCILRRGLRPRLMARLRRVCVRNRSRHAYSTRLSSEVDSSLNRLS